MGTCLLDLPNEILSTIFNHFDIPWSEQQDDPPITKPELCALALTCTRLSEVVRGIIFRNISLKWDPFLYSPFNNPNALKLLLRTWRQNPPFYLNQLQRINWYTYSSNLELHQEFFDQISQSQSLHELNLFDCILQNIKLMVSFLHNPPGRNFSGLKSLRAHPSTKYTNYSNTLLDLCTTPHLLKLEVGFCAISTTFTQLEAELAAHRNSVLETLHLSKRPMIGVEDLGLLLSVCKSLKRLNIAPPAPGIKYDDGERQRFPATNLRFSSAAVVQALLPVTGTLEDLSITNPETIYYCQSDHTRFDLSKFRALRKLKVSSFVLTGGHHLSMQNDEVQGVGCSSIWDILPPRLEEIYIAFDSLNGIFYNIELDNSIHHNHLGTAFKRYWRDGPGSRTKFQKHLQWISDLIEQKRKGKVLKCLKRLDLVECHTLKWLQQRDPTITMGPHSLRCNYPDFFAKFDEAGVRVDVRIYAPLGWDHQSRQYSRMRHGKSR